MKRYKEEGSAILLALIVILVTAILVGVATTVTGGVTKLTHASRDYTKLRFETEGAMETAWGAWLTASNSKYGPPLGTDIPANLRGPTPSSTPFSYTFAYPYSTGGQLQINPTDQYGVPTSTGSSAGTPTAVPISVASYPGWSGLRFSYVASVGLQGTNIAGNTIDYRLTRIIQYVSVPLFQATAFFDGDIELYNPATMTITGLVHTNGSAYLSSASSTGLTFTGNVSYVNAYSSTTPPVGASSWTAGYGGAMYSPVYPSGQSVQVKAVSDMEPLGTAPASVFAAGNPNTDSMRFLIERPNTSYSDPAVLSQRRLFNKAGIVITISGTTKTVTTQNNVSLTTAQTTTLQNAITQQTMYDYREGNNVAVSTLDISQADPVLNAATNFSGNGLLYIDDVSSTTTEKGIRLKNGGTLPSSGLTVASDNGIYIQGDYNTGTPVGGSGSTVPTNAANGSPTSTMSPVVSGYTKVPSAVIGDAVMILSNNWSDTNSSKALTSRTASDTTVNTAIVAGFVPSIPTNYSGGLNNFPRFLENWSGQGFTYYGSMVQLFNSAIFTGLWDTGSIYNPPNRCWNFDSNFLLNPPPGSLDVVTRMRGPLIRN